MKKSRNRETELRAAITDSTLPDYMEPMDGPETLRWFATYMRKNGIMGPKTRMMQALHTLANRMEDAVEEEVEA